MAYPSPGTYSAASPFVAKIVSNTVPFILAPTGSMGNNGAYTNSTAFNTTYPNAYVYFPAGALYTNSAAGWYFTQMSSTTVGVVYNFPYAIGVPQIPTSLTAYAISASGPGAFTGTTSATASLNVTIPANSLTVSSVLRTTGLSSMSATANSKTVAVTFGGTTLFTETTTSASDYGYLISAEAANQGSQSNQVISPTGAPGATTAVNTYGSIATTADQQVIVNLTRATATDFLVLETFGVEILG